MIVNYLKQQEEFSQKYGEKNTIVLMQIGAFYELYEYNPEKSEESNLSWPDKRIGSVIEIASLLNMIVTRKDKKKKYSLTNCDMAGFPVVSYEKHRDVLLNNNYTIVRIDQRKTLKNEKDEIERFVAEILSPATNLSNISNIPITNNIVSIYIEVLKETFCKEDYIIAVGLSCIDVTTGENTVLEVYSQEKNAISAIQEIYRYLSITRPREVILNLDKKNNDYESFLFSVLQLDKISTYINRIVEKEFLKVEYQTNFLSKVFYNSKNIIEDLSLERIYYGCVSYIILLQYCYEHNTNCIEKINSPNTAWLDVDNYLVLAHNAIDQLNILPCNQNVKSKHNRSNKNIDSLFSVVNYTKTALGKRYLMNMLTNPITDVSQLNESYDMISDCVCKPELLKNLYILKDIPDIERYQRKLYLKLIKPHELAILFNAYIKIVNIYTFIYNSDSKLYSLLFDSSPFSQCLTKFLSKFKLDVLSKSRLDNGKLIYTEQKEDNVEQKEQEVDEQENIEIKKEEMLIHEGVDTKFDKYCIELRENKFKLDKIVDVLNSYLSKTTGKKIVYNKDSKKDRNLGLFTTAHKASILQKIPELKTYSFINVNKEVMITSDEIAQTCKKYADLQIEMSRYLYSLYMITINEIAEYTFFSTLTNFISKIDFICSGALCAIQNKYIRPKIEGELPFFDIKDMRHPIVESLIYTEYVTNDIALGQNTKGLLLYGQNSSGKSTFGKAIALNIILAQAGLFTAGTLKYFPYNKIVTRLSGNDSVLEGLSSFVIEMKELRTILRNADRKTLVIADEIARGTESVSATSLTVSSVTYLLNRGATFLFSTHLHSLVEMKDIVECKDKLNISHLALKYDKEKNCLIYDRKLHEGSGDSLYGLEVAASLGLDDVFIQKAYEVRKELLQENVLLMSIKKSKYNNKKYVDACFICGTRDLKKLETHHIEEQKKSDKQGFIGTMHKNISSNLTELCSTCHDMLHSNNLQLIKQETSNGISVTLGV
jgi:DNA mismatch repair protein MutS